MTHDFKGLPFSPPVTLPLTTLVTTFLSPPQTAGSTMSVFYSLCSSVKVRLLRRGPIDRTLRWCAFSRIIFLSFFTTLLARCPPLAPVTPRTADVFSTASSRDRRSGGGSGVNGDAGGESPSHVSSLRPACLFKSLCPPVVLTARSYLPTFPFLLCRPKPPMDCSGSL